MIAIRIAISIAFLASVSAFAPQAIAQDATPQTSQITSQITSQVTSQVTFKFDRPVAGIPVPHYTMELHGDGAGLYHAEIPVANAPETQKPETQKIDRPIAFTPPSIKIVFDLVDSLQSSNVPCASKIKNIADTGIKTLTYRDPKGSGTCTYNFSENKAVAQLTEFFQSVEFTLEEGRALDFKHRFDRLGLDAEMTILAAAAASGRANEIGNIAATLRSIAGDMELIQRVRLRAAKLLEGVQSGE